MRLAGPLALAALLASCLPAPALASHEGRPPASATPDVLETAHFQVHYAAATFGEAQTVADAAERTYTRLVTDAGLRAPVNDGDGKVDIYVRIPPDRPDFRGGAMYRDPSHRDPEGLGQAGYLYLTPEMEVADLRFRAAHELFHVIARSYAGINGTPLEEGFANWAAEWGLPDAEPGDHNLGQPDVPFDCEFGSFQGKPCGNGYRHWLWIERQVEDFGAGFAAGVLARFRAGCLAAACTEWYERAVNEELSARTGVAPADDALRLRVGDYWRRILDPGAWSTTAVTNAFRLNEGPPALASTEYLGSGAVGEAYPVNHLAAAFVRLARWSAEPYGPGDKLRVRVQTSVPLLAGNAPAVALMDGPNWSRELVQLTRAGDAWTADMPFDAARFGDATLVLVNDGGSDAVPFDWSAELVRGEPSPPANDERSGARRVKLGTHGADIAYAGGIAHEESPSFCTERSGRGAGQGVWFRFKAPTRGQYSFDATGSDFRAVINVIPLKGDPRIRAPRPGCSHESKPVRAKWFAGQEALVYIARHGEDPGFGTGHEAKLEISGPARHSKKCRRALKRWKKDQESKKRRRTVVRKCGVTVLPRG